MINIVDKNLCCGCSACVSICPKKCIEMREDEEGFKYPVVDQSRCINCGLCDKVCIYQNGVVSGENAAPKKDASYIAARAHVDGVFMQSSSGGIFPLLAIETIKKSGVVFGARFSEGFESVYHGYIEDAADLKFLQNSKYVQSSMGEAYVQCRDFLKASRPVLFSGTPCQIAGLASFLGKEYDNLLTVDVACYGVPSPKVWREYLRFCADKNKGAKITDVSFRKKTVRNGKLSSFNFVVSPDMAEEPSYFSLYGRAFTSNLITRPCCDSCVIRQENKSDITLGDFWGVENVFKEFDINDGVSVVIANTGKGADFLRLVKPQCEFYREIGKESALRSNKGLRSPKRERNPQSAAFFDEINRPGADVVRALNRALKKPPHLRMLDFLRAGVRFLRRKFLKSAS